jgi:hypothetical protein
MPTQNEIERRAYELYEQRGREDGHDHDDWLRAEAQLRTAEAEAKPPAVTDEAGAAAPRRSRGQLAQRPAAS